MTRWNLLDNIFLQIGNIDAIGKAWPLFFLLVFNMDKLNKYCSNYSKLARKLRKSINTVKDWRQHLVKNKVIKVIRGNGCMTFVLLSPYDSLVTCEQDDIAQVKMVGDPATKRMLDKISDVGNMTLLPIIVEMQATIENLKKKVD